MRVHRRSSQMETQDIIKQTQQLKPETSIGFCFLLHILIIAMENGKLMRTPGLHLFTESSTAKCRNSSNP